MAEVKPQTSPVAQPTSKSPTTTAQPEKRPASPSATHPILFATKSNLFLHFNPPEAPHLRFAPQPKDTDPNYQFLLLKYEPNKSPVSIRKVEDGMKVLLCLNEPRWYAGFKSDGQLFLLNTPTTLTLWTIKYPDTSSPHFLLVNESGKFLTFSEGTLTLSDDDSGFEKLFRFYFIKPSALQKRKTPSPKPEATPADTVDKKVRFSPEVSTAIPRPKSVEPSNALVPIDNIKRPRSTGPQGRLHTNGRFGYRDNDRRPMSENMGVRRPPGPAEDTWPRRPPSPENFDRRHPRHSAPSRPSSREGFRRPGPRSEAKSGATFAPHEPSYPAHRLPPSQIPTQDEELRQLKEFKEAPKNYNPNNNSNLSIPVAIKYSKDRTLCKTTKKLRLYQWEKVEMGKYSDSSAFFHVHYVELKKGGGVELKEFIDLNKANGKPVALRSVENGKFMCLWDGGEIGEQTDLRDNAIWIFKKLPHSPLAFALHSNSDNQFFSVENNHVRANSQKIGINQSFTFFVPPTLQQAVAQQSRPQIGKGMLGVTVAITGASLMGASAAIVQMVLNINRTNTQSNQANQATAAPHNTGANPANHPAPAPPNDPTFGNNPHWLGPDPSVTGGGWGIPTMNPNGTPVTPQAGNVPPPTMPGRPVDPTGFGPAPGGPAPAPLGPGPGAGPNPIGPNGPGVNNPVGPNGPNVNPAGPGNPNANPAGPANPNANPAGPANPNGAPGNGAPGAGNPNGQNQNGNNNQPGGGLLESREGHNGDSNGLLDVHSGDHFGMNSLEHHGFGTDLDFNSQWHWGDGLDMHGFHDPGVGHMDSSFVGFF